MEHGIKHNIASKTFEINVDEHEAKISYYLTGGAIVFISTWVPKAIVGKGIAAALTKYALEYAKQSGLKVIPRCAYTQAYLRRHEEYKELL